ncbi:MAG TPA: LysR family transcriptional regulator [Bacteroidota bacterium]|nr:LysR family transcriptional regulator [Bacteroidota bacterium]
MTMTLEVRHLILIKAVAESGNISRAGIQLHLTQSALSHQLRTIEERLGVPLFLRHNKRMTLSKPGKRLLEAAEHILKELQRAEEDVKRIASNKEGVLRISTECYTAYHWLPSIVKVFNRKFPNVDVQVIHEATARPIEYLIKGDLDLAIVPWILNDRQIVLHSLFQDKLVVIVHPRHPLAEKRYVVPEDFADQHLFMYSERERVEEWTFYNTILAPAGVTPQKISYLQLTEGIIEMVKAGLGIAVLAHWAVDPEIKRHSIKGLPLMRKGFIRQWSAATLKNGYVPPYMEAFIGMLANRSMPAMKYY